MMTSIQDAHWMEWVPFVRHPARAGRKGRLSFTLAGLTLMCVLVVGILGALNIQANLLLLLIAVSSGVVVLSFVIPVRILRGLEVRRRAPHTVSAGSPFTCVYSLSNRSRWRRAWSVSLRESIRDRSGCLFGTAHVPMLQAGEQIDVRVPARCDARGTVSLPSVRMECRFPLGLFRYVVDVEQPGEVLVLPALGRLRQSMAGYRRAGRGAPQRVPQTPSGEDEFSGLRDYREGDSLRHVHWRRSARTGELLVREDTPLQGNQVILLSDPWPWENGSEGREALSGASGSLSHGASDREKLQVAEQVISATATAVCDALEHGMRVGLIVRAATPVMIPPAGGRAHRQRLLRELACASCGCALSVDDLLAGLRWRSAYAGRWLICTARSTEAHRRVLRFAAGRSRSVVLAAPGTYWWEHVFVPVQGRVDKKGV